MHMTLSELETAPQSLMAGWLRGLGPEADYWVKPPHSEVLFGSEVWSVAQSHPSVYSQSQAQPHSATGSLKPGVLLSLDLPNGAREKLTERTLEGDIRLWQAEEKKGHSDCVREQRCMESRWHSGHSLVGEMRADTRNAKTHLCPVLHPQSRAWCT